MLKLAQQLAVAEGRLQEEEEHIRVLMSDLHEQHVADSAPAATQPTQCCGSTEPYSGSEPEQLPLGVARHLNQACQAAGMLSPPSLALLQLCRHELKTAASCQAGQGSSLWANALSPLVHQNFMCNYGSLWPQASLEITMVGSLRGQVGSQTLS